MPATEKVYPEWVQKYRMRGMTVKKKGESYYLYKRTSKRVPGKKYPQPVDHVLDDTFREDRSPAKKSRNSLALIRKFAYNILRLVSIQRQISRPNTELMDLLHDDLNLLGTYIFDGIVALS